MLTICMDGQWQYRSRYLQQEEIYTLKLQDLSDDDEDGYILEVDLHYPTSLHNQHDDLLPNHW